MIKNKKRRSAIFSGVIYAQCFCGDNTSLAALSDILSGEGLQDLVYIGIAYARIKLMQWSSFLGAAKNLANRILHDTIIIDSINALTRVGELDMAEEFIKFIVDVTYWQVAINRLLESISKQRASGQHQENKQVDFQVTISLSEIRWVRYKIDDQVLGSILGIKSIAESIEVSEIKPQQEIDVGKSRAIADFNGRIAKQFIMVNHPSVKGDMERLVEFIKQSWYEYSMIEELIQSSGLVENIIFANNSLSIELLNDIESELYEN